MKQCGGGRKEFKWTIGADKNFNLLKEKVTEQPVLALQILTRCFKLTVILVALQ